MWSVILSHSLNEKLVAFILCFYTSCFDSEPSRWAGEQKRQKRGIISEMSFHKYFTALLCPGANRVRRISDRINPPNIMFFVLNFIVNE